MRIRMFLASAESHRPMGPDGEHVQGGLLPAGVIASE